MYADSGLSDAQKLERKASLYESIPDRIAASAIVDQHNYQRWARRSAWNNARLIQFKTYNAADADFAAVLQRHALPDGRTDVKGFIDEVQRIEHPPGAAWAKDPFVALHAAAVAEAGVTLSR